jgi:hypothetical protein
MIVAFLGVFTAQTLTVLLSATFILLSAAVLVLVLDAIGGQTVNRDAVLALQPAVMTAGVSGRSMRSLIARQTAAPSRAPPTFFLRQRWIGSMGLVPRE